MWWELLSCMHFSCQKPVDWKDQTRNKKPYIHVPPQAQKTNIVPENAISIQQKKKRKSFSGTMFAFRVLLEAFLYIMRILKSEKPCEQVELLICSCIGMPGGTKVLRIWDFQKTWRNRQVFALRISYMSFLHFTRDDSWQLTVQQHLPQKKNGQ